MISIIQNVAVSWEFSS